MVDSDTTAPTVQLLGSLSYGYPQGSTSDGSEEGVLFAPKDTTRRFAARTCRVVRPSPHAGHTATVSLRDSALDNGVVLRDGDDLPALAAELVEVVLKAWSDEMRSG